MNDYILVFRKQPAINQEISDVLLTPEVKDPPWISLHSLGPNPHHPRAPHIEKPLEMHPR